MDGFTALALGIAGVLVLVAALGILVGRYLLPARPRQTAPAPAVAPPPMPATADPTPDATLDTTAADAQPPEASTTIATDVPTLASETTTPVVAVAAAAVPTAATPPRGGATAVGRPAEAQPIARGGATAFTGPAAEATAPAQPADDGPAPEARSAVAAQAGSAVEAELRERLAHLEMEFSRLETGAVSAWDRTMPALQQHIETLEADLAKAERELRRTQQALADSGEQIDQLLAKSRPKLGGATRA